MLSLSIESTKQTNIKEKGKNIQTSKEKNTERTIALTQHASQFLASVITANRDIKQNLSAVLEIIIADLCYNLQV